MGKHETRICPRCAGFFECKAGTITQCQCSAIQLTGEERGYISARFDDCLCIACLRVLREEYSYLAKNRNVKESPSGSL